MLKQKRSGAPVRHSVPVNDVMTGKEETPADKKSDAAVPRRPRGPNEELLLLYEIGRVVNSTLDRAEVLQSIMRMTTDIFKAEAGSIMLLDKEGTLRIEAAQGLSPAITRNTRIRMGEGIAGWVAQTGEALLLDGKVRDPRFKLLVERKDEVKSSLCVPLKTKEKVIGVLMLRNPASAPSFTSDHLRFLSAVADQVAIALENAGLYKAERERSEELSLEKTKIEAIISSMADGVVVTHPDGRIALVNPGVEKVFGINQDSVIGNHFDVLFKGLQFDRHHEKVLSERKPVSAEITLHKPTESFFRLFSTPMSGADGESLGVVTVLQDITELKQIGKMKSEIVSLVTHELKTPLTSIQGFVEVLLARDLPRERVVNYLTIVKQETVRLVRLIDNLLDLSKLESGEFKLHREAIDITPIVIESVRSVESIAPKHRFAFSPAELVPALFPPIFADEDMLAQVLNNLLSNAIKYSPEGGTVTVAITPRDPFLEVAVSDEGIGIPADKLPFLFERFYRVQSPSTQEIKGTGLGLANSKYIIERHGGTLRVKSTEGQGSTFTFTLPFHSPEAEKEEAS